MQPSHPPVIAHTPGPWVWADDYTLAPAHPDPRRSHVHTILFTDSGCGFINDPDPAATHAELAADRALIAAAPTLLSALQELLSALNDMDAVPHRDNLYLYYRRALSEAAAAVIIATREGA